MTPARRSVLAAIAIGMALSACGGAEPEGAAVGAGDPSRGADLFAANCAACHGPAAEGTDVGPSFLSDIYAPSHHGDAAFLLAVQRGVQPHHWDLGPMPPIEGLSPADVTDIVAHVRGLQRAAGLIS